jgi:hypothetical protein
VAVFVCVLTLPWWLTSAILVGLTIYLPTYFEIIFFGFLFDTLYSKQHYGLITATLFLAVVMFVKTKIRT